MGFVFVCFALLIRVEHKRKAGVMSVVFVSEPVVRVYVDYIMWCVVYVTHEDDDGYMEGGVLRNIKPYKQDLDKAADFVRYMNQCIANGERFDVEQYDDGFKMMKRLVA